MKKIVFIILCMMLAAPESSANSLDELYRDLIRADNEGYLPLFVKNRKVPDILSDDTPLNLWHLLLHQTMFRKRSVLLTPAKRKPKPPKQKL